MRLQVYLFGICIALSSCYSDEGTINEEVQIGYEVSLFDGFEYRLYPPCTDTALFGVTKTKTIKTLDTNLYSTQIILCRTDTFSVLGNEIIFKWNSKEWAQPSSDRKGWENSYPEGTYFTWWGCVDSIGVNGLYFHNSMRESTLPNYSEVHFSLKKDALARGDSTLLVFIPAPNGKGPRGVLIDVENSKIVDLQ